MDELVPTIRDTPLGKCIGKTLVDMTSDDPEECDKNGRARVYFHFSNGETIFATLGSDKEDLVGMIGMNDA